MNEADVGALPPLLQVILASALSGFAALSVAARLLPSLAWVWREPPEERGLEHLVEYTLVPCLVAVACTSYVAWRWDASSPWLGTWSLAAVIVTLAGVSGGLVLVGAGAAIGKRWDTSDAASARAWAPFVLVLAGIASCAAGVLLGPRL